MIRVSPLDVHDAWAADMPWPEDDDLAGLPETVVEPGDGGCDTQGRDDAHAGRQEATPAGRSLR